MSKQTQYRLGWQRELPDLRDKTYSVGLTINELPDKADLRTSCPTVYDQGDLGSCTANAIAAHLDFNRHKQKEKFIKPSRLYIYYNERKDQGTVSYDAGATIRESVKAVVKYGACPEKEWPYSVGKFTTKPSDKCYTDAIQYEALTYLKLPQNKQEMMGCLAAGFPIVVGISVYDSFHDADKTGVVPMPSSSDSLLGGHAVMVVGYDINANHWIVRNSWGKSWGDKGYFYLPLDYLLNHKLSSDFWTLREVK